LLSDSFENSILLKRFYFNNALDFEAPRLLNFNSKGYLNDDFILNESYKNFRKNNKYLYNFFEQLIEDNKYVNIEQSI
jgi:hypothetical protein